MKEIRLFLYLALLCAVTPASAQRSMKKEGVRLTLNSVKVLDDTLFLQFKLSNRSLLIYHLSHLRCYQQDRHVPRRTAVQETELKPLESLSLQSVLADSKTTFLIPYQAFSVPNTKDFFVQVAEAGNTRSLRLRLKGRRFRHMIRNY